MHFNCEVQQSRFIARRVPGVGDDYHDILRLNFLEVVI